MNNKPHSEETKRKISLALQGHSVSLETRKKLSEKNTGFRHSEDTKLRISASMKGVSTAWLTGRKLSAESIRKRSLAVSGANHWKWKGGVTSLNHKIRQSSQYRNWRTSIFTRDRFTCQLCGETGVRLNADHIEAFSVIMKKHSVDSFQSALICADLWDIANGRTLCVPCHKKTDNYGAKALIKQN